MKKIVITSLASVALFLALAAAPASATIYHFAATLTGPDESPPNPSPGFGSGTVDFDDVANTMQVDISFSGLLGTTSASHIHSATTVAGTGTAGVATTTPNFTGFPLGVTSGTYSHLFDMTLSSSYNPVFVTANGGTTATAEAALLAGMIAGKAYWNIHTSVVPGGEIRGFLTPVPEPTTIALLGLGALGLVIAVRRNRK